MKPICSFFLLAMLFSCSGNKQAALQQEAQTFLDQYTAQYLVLRYESSLANWASNTHIVEGDTTNAFRTKQAREKVARFTGSEAHIEQARHWLTQRESLLPIQVRQLEAILYDAANNPGTVPELVSRRIAAETAQVEKLYGFDFQLDGKSVSTNDLDAILAKSKEPAARLAAWEASKEVGKGLKTGLVELRDLRNQTVQALGYDDYFGYQVSEYGMTTPEMAATCEELIRDIWPLYRELHTYARYELAARYGTEVPDYLPAHWLPDRWGQKWGSLVEVEGIDLDGLLAEKGAEWQVRQAERFYVSLGFDTLPASFYELSSLYPLPPDADYKKNNHASAWHLDLNHDVRSLMSVIPNARWYETTHHELGHIYYYLSYTNPDVPPLLRGGANRAYHEAVGSLMGLAAMQKPFLSHLQLIPEDLETDETQTLLKEALNNIIFIPFGAGTMTTFERELYAENLPPDQFNARWWEIVKEYQGIVPPSERGEEYCDAATKTHINNDAAQYYDYPLSHALLFQFHDHIARNILRQDPHATNYYGSKETGDFLRSMLSKGATEDWRLLLKETTGQELNGKAMLAYFQPLMGWLKEHNEGREHTLPER